MIVKIVVVGFVRVVGVKEFVGAIGIIDFVGIVRVQFKHAFPLPFPPSPPYYLHRRERPSQRIEVFEVV